MGIASRYWTLVCIHASGKRNIVVIEPAQTFFQTHCNSRFEPDQIPDKVLQTELLEQHQATANLRSPAAWCLRCFISHVIEQVCIQLEAQFGQEHGFRRQDLYPFVLQDWYPPRPTTEHPPTAQHQSLTQKVLQTYRPSKGSLATWVIRLVRSDRTLNAFLLERGIYLVSDWAILNDTNPPQVERILSQFHHLTPYEVKEAVLLLQSYHAVYRCDRIRQRQSSSRGLCPDPSAEQLARMQTALDRADPACAHGPPSLILGRLQTLAHQLRQYRISARGGAFAQVSLDAPEQTSGLPPQLAQPNPDATADEHDNFLQRYRAQFNVSLDEAIEQSLNRRLENLQRHQTQKAKAFLKALYLFHCRGQGMAAIAPQVDLKAQYQVSRLLKLKDLRADVQRHILLGLRDRVLEQAQAFAEPARLQTLNGQLDAILNEQVENMIQEAAAEASIPGNRPVQSLYARRLCHHLDRRMTP